MNTLLTTREVAEILNVSYQTIRRLKSDPIEPLFYLRIGGSYVKNKKTSHALRHSYGNEWVKNGKPIKVLSKMMMHSIIKVTNDFYIDADPSFFEKHVANA